MPLTVYRSNQTSQVKSNPVRHAPAKDCAPARHTRAYELAASTSPTSTTEDMYGSTGPTTQRAVLTRLATATTIDIRIIQ